MKKILLTLLLLVSLGMTAMAENLTNSTKLNSTTIPAGGSASFFNNEITISFPTTNSSFRQNDHIRLYANTAVTITGAKGVTITKITLTATSASYAKTLKANVGTVNGQVWTGSANEVKLTNSSTAQARYNNIEITYESASGPAEPEDFVFEGFKDQTLIIGRTATLELPADAPTITYTSSNEAVATVTDNTINALAVGTATITASWKAVAEKWNAGSANFIVTVGEAPDSDVALFDFTTSGNVGTLTSPNLTLPSSGGINIDGTTFTNGLVSFVTAKKPSGSNNTMWWSAGDCRLYAGNTMKVSVPEGYYIASVTIINTTRWANMSTGDVTGAWDNTSDHVWTPQGTPSVVEFSSAPGRVDFAKMEVEYAKVPAAEPALEGDVTCTVKRSKYGWLSANYSFSVANYDGHEIVVTMKVLDAQGNEVQGLSIENVEPVGPARAASQAFSGTILAKGEALGTPENPATENFTVALSATADGKALFTDAKTESNVATGIEDVIVDENAPAEYFNLQGIRVSEPQAGQLYIKRQGNKATKVRF